MSRFKTSKYKNAFSYVYKQENWINDVNVSPHLSSRGNLIDASTQFVAFSQDLSSVSVLPLTAGGRFTKFPTVSVPASDLAFSPFHASVLVTGGSDGSIRLWKIPDDLSNDAILSKPVATLPQADSGIESLGFHPAADNVLVGGAGTVVKIWDINSQTEMYSLGGHQDVVQSCCWSGNGSVVASVCKKERQKSIKLFDPRQSTNHVQEATAHSAQKDSRVLWLGDSPYFVSTGTDMTRSAELALWDMGNLSKPLSRVSLGTSSSGSTMLFYDQDTKMVYVALKNEATILYYEFMESSTSLSQGNHVFRGNHQHKGLTLVPKTAVDVMSCQVARFLQLTQHAVIPIGYHVQRKSHTEFHEDLFPDTNGPLPSMTAEQWREGSNTPVEKVSLNPALQKQSGQRETKASLPAQERGPSQINGNNTPTAIETAPTVAQSTLTSQPERSSAKEQPTRKVMQLVRSSKLRHIEGAPCHRSTKIEKIPPLNSTVPGDSNSFQANRERVAAVIARAGGQICVFELSRPGRLDTDTVPTLQNVANVMDFVFDPFDNNRIVAACDDARIRVWRIPEGGLTTTLTEPEAMLIGHQDKPNVLAFHPLAKSVLASAGYDGCLYIWNIDKQEIAITLDIKELLFAMAWSPCGQFLVTFSKEGRLCLYNPRQSSDCVREGVGPEGRRGGRVVWLDNEHIVVSGFSKSSNRTLTVYLTSDLSKPCSTISISVSPATLMLTFDPDTKLLYVSGKGDKSVLVYEYVPEDPPYLFDVAPFSCQSTHQAIGFLPKVVCDVKKVEIAHGVRLTPSTVEQFVIRVPRTRLEYFQDDLYPPTHVTWESVQTAKEWLEGAGGREQNTVSMRPADMKSLSEAPPTAQATKRFQSYNPKFKTDQEKKDELMSAMIHRMGDKDDDPLPQKAVEGCDSDEWSD